MEQQGREVEGGLWTSTTNDRDAVDMILKSHASPLGTSICKVSIDDEVKTIQDKPHYYNWAFHWEH